MYGFLMRTLYWLKMPLVIGGKWRNSLNTEKWKSGKVLLERGSQWQCPHKTAAPCFRLAFSYIGKGESVRQVWGLTSWHHFLGFGLFEDNVIARFWIRTRPGALCVTSENCKGVTSWILVRSVRIKKLLFLTHQTFIHSIFIHVSHVYCLYKQYIALIAEDIMDNKDLVLALQNSVWCEMDIIQIISKDWITYVRIMVMESYLEL